MTLPQELQAARLRLAKERPYLASAAWALYPVPKPGLGTMAVDMYWRLYYDPDLSVQWPVEVTEGVLYHEICHLLRNHPDRMKDLNPQFSNIAADAEINDDLILEKVKFPNTPITPQSIGQPDNLLAEEYYAALENRGGLPSPGQADDNNKDSSDKNESNIGSQRSQNQQEQQEKEKQEQEKQQRQQNQQNKSSRNGDKEKNGSLAKDNSRWKDDSHSKEDTQLSEENSKDNNSSSKQMDDKVKPMPGSGSCGSCATGQMAPWEDAPPDKGSSCGIGKTEAELIRREVANQIKEHARGQGRIPGHLARWAEDKLNPKVDWRKQLAAAVRYAAADTAGAADYSYRRPSRRQGQAGDRGVIIPSLRRPVPLVAVVADTSASISEIMLAQTLAEISGILKSLGQKEGVHVLAVDQNVHSCHKVFRPEQIVLTGGGGTDMGAGLAALCKIKPLPQIGIVITDGQTSWPDRPPRGMKVIVVLSGDGTAPDWARVIKICA